jgi:addiction module RelE/StbE family toxin
MQYTILYKKSVKKDFNRLSLNKKEILKIKDEIENKLSQNPYKGKPLRAAYEGLFSLHIKRKIVVVYKIFAKDVLVLAVEQRENAYKKPY